MSSGDVRSSRVNSKGLTCVMLEVMCERPVRFRIGDKKVLVRSNEYLGTKMPGNVRYREPVNQIFLEIADMVQEWTPLAQAIVSASLLGWCQKGIAEHLVCSQRYVRIVQKKLREAWDV